MAALITAGAVMGKYVARIYLQDDEIEDNTGDDVDELHAWMLARAEGKFGDVHGEVIEIKTNKIIRQFRKAPPD